MIDPRVEKIVQDMGIDTDGWDKFDWVDEFTNLRYKTVDRIKVYDGRWYQEWSEIKETPCGKFVCVPEFIIKSEIGLIDLDPEVEISLVEPHTRTTTEYRQVPQ